MADEFSFDVVSKVDLQAVDDAVNAANKEIQVRFDFKGSVSRFEFDKKDAKITMHSDDEGKLKSVVEILKARFAKRGIDLKALDYQKVEVAMGGAVRQVAKLKQGIPTDKAKEMVADIKSAKLKVVPSIQSEQVRVTSKSKDSLQEAINLLKKKDYGVPMQFSNFR
jgi:cyclic-di-GMP-binding protein